MSLGLSLIDAANNCTRDGAVAVLTLRSGATFEGRLEKPSSTATVHIRTKDGGWDTVVIEEIAAVSSRRRL